MYKRFLIILTALVVVPANAATLLTVDLSVENQITITATDGLSDATSSGSDTTGFYLASFFDSSVTTAAGDTFVSGNLTSAANVSNGSPDLFTTTLGGFGLNVWSFADGLTADFVAGTVAFSGSATWDLTADSYAAFLMGPASGDIFFPADSDDDIVDAVLLGQWERATPVPLPAAVWLLGSALLGFGVFGRKQS